MQRKVPLFIKISFVILLVIFGGSFLLTFLMEYGFNFKIRLNGPLFYDNVLSGNLKRHVRYLSEDIGQRSASDEGNLNRAVDYITRELEKQNCKVGLQEFTVNDRVFKNVVGSMNESASDGVIILGAHYDTFTNTPGADDNASGVAGMIELARILNSRKKNGTFKFIAFANEEKPYFLTENMGSMVYAKEAASTGEKIKLLVNLEMIGDYQEGIFSQTYPSGYGTQNFRKPNRGNYLLFNAANLDANLVELFYKGFVNGSVVPMLGAVDPAPMVIGSDDIPFSRRKVPTITLSDTIYLRNKNYHTPMDTYEKLNYAYMADVIEGVAEGILQIK